MPACSLVCHHSTPTDAVTGIDVEVLREADGSLHFRYALRGDGTRIVLPAPASAQHTDDLWHHTCFEAFIACEDDAGYVECNFSPSRAWATYRFTRYRTQMARIEPDEPPRIELQRNRNGITLDARLRLDDVAGARLRLGIAAVIEERDARLSYWALRHPRARPDFHHRAGFILRLD